MKNFIKIGRTFRAVACNKVTKSREREKPKTKREKDPISSDLRIFNCLLRPRTLIKSYEICFFCFDSYG